MTNVFLLRKTIIIIKLVSYKKTLHLITKPCQHYQKEKHDYFYFTRKPKTIIGWLNCLLHFFPKMIYFYFRIHVCVCYNFTNWLESKFYNGEKLKLLPCCWMKCKQQKICATCSYPWHKFYRVENTIISYCHLHKNLLLNNAILVGQFVGE